MRKGRKPPGITNEQIDMPLERDQRRATRDHWFNQVLKVQEKLVMVKSEGL